MKAFGRLMAVLATLGLAAPGMAAQEPLVLVGQPDIEGTVALPRIAQPLDDAARLINAALDRLDARLRSALAACQEEGTLHTDWHRTVATPMTGPHFLSLVVDDMSCGWGPYPNYGRFALVYDLDTGHPVNWARLLPANLAGVSDLDMAADGSKVGTVNSRVLHKLYKQGYPNGGAASDRADCIDATTDLPFILWTDAALDALMIQPIGLPHATQACEVVVAIPAATLRALGVTPRLLDALKAAHERH